ncbi:hypothetical protein [Sphingobacterium kitahiroshimense]|uniref:Uncharacterized protein n=1 Tax=Sphingobacterium kitahiroshimense TaxID=470446 RepID=A0ABV0BPJ0_9SPHI
MLNTNNDIFDILAHIHSSKCDKTNNFEEFLDSWTNEIISQRNISFPNGIHGLGWLISYLNTIDFLNNDTDKLLYDVDDVLYKLAINEILNNSDTNKLLDYLSYFIERLLNKSLSVNNYREVLLYEVVYLIIADLNKKINLGSSDIFTNVMILIKYNFILKQELLHIDMIKEVYNLLLDKTVNYIISNDTSNYIEQLYLLKLSDIYNPMKTDISHIIQNAIKNLVISKNYKSDWYEIVNFEKKISNHSFLDKKNLYVYVSNFPIYS